jgi:hypothetical protein
MVIVNCFIQKSNLPAVSSSQAHDPFDNLAKLIDVSIDVFCCFVNTSLIQNLGNNLVINLIQQMIPKV